MCVKLEGGRSLSAARKVADGQGNDELEEFTNDGAVILGYGGLLLFNHWPCASDVYSRTLSHQYSNSLALPLSTQDA